MNLEQIHQFQKDSRQEFKKRLDRYHEHEAEMQDAFLDHISMGDEEYEEDEDDTDND